MRPSPVLPASEIEAELSPLLEPVGLSVFGWFLMDEAPFNGRAAMLIGNGPVDGAHPMWDAFSGSREHHDGEPDALDRWTSRVIGPVAKRKDMVALYPFGERVWPFQRWAMAATGMQQSPLGILIHPDHGLWQAFRAVLVCNGRVSLSTVEKSIHPCDACADKPCLRACPVSAFSEGSFDVSRCRQHLSSEDEPDCMALGCRARAACPVGIPYPEEQIRFHMQAFAGR